MKFSVPWQYDALGKAAPRADEDGFVAEVLTASAPTFKYLQAECWSKFVTNPQINTAIRDHMGRLTGNGFEVTSDNEKIERKITEIWTDPRNRLYSLMSKYVVRSEVEGELFLPLTVHSNGFIEVDFIDPGLLQGGTDNSGIYFHPTKQIMPLAYEFKNPRGSGKQIIPSIYIAYFPQLLSVLNGLLSDNDKKYLNINTVANSKFDALNGFNRFVVCWDKGYLTKRNISHLLTTIKWINYYEDLKKYEIDHKKSAGAYVWTVTIEDAKSFKMWLALTDEERRKTGIMAKKTPGSTLILPPGMKLEVKNPQLPKISDADTDIMEMITSGLNKPNDMVTGSSKGTYGSVKASRGPQSDRIEDEKAYFERFMRYDFWRPIFFLSSSVSSFPKYIYVEEVVDFVNKEPVKKKVKKEPHELIEFSFPVSEISDMESRAKGTLGVKHGSLAKSLGIPHEELAKKLGFSNYRKLRLRHATEEEKYPELFPEVDQESQQEIEEGEKKKGNQKTKPKIAKE